MFQEELYPAIYKPNIVLLFSLGLEIKNEMKTYAASLPQYGPVTSRGNVNVSKILVT